MHPVNTSTHSLCHVRSLACLQKVMPNNGVCGSDLTLRLKWHTHILVSSCFCLIYIPFSRVFQRWKLVKILSILPLWNTGI